mgnify:CR=1 FL=1
MLNRRNFIKSAAITAVGAGALPGLVASARANTGARRHVVIVGGGYGGATPPPPPSAGGVRAAQPPQNTCACGATAQST